MQRECDLFDLLPADRVDSVQRLLADIQITFVSCRFWRNDAPWRLSRRRVADSFLLAPIRGTVEVTLDHACYRVEPGDVLLLADGVHHALALVGPEPVLEQVALHCFVTNAWRQTLLSLFKTPVVHLPTGTDWHERLRRLSCLAAHNDDVAQRRAELLIADFLVALIEEGAPLEWPARSIDPRVASALQVVRDTYDADLTVDGLARKAGLSEVQFRHLFTRATGQTPRRYIVEHRLKVAVGLLESSTLSVKEIAHRVGFNSDHYFHRTFKSAYGATPSAYRHHAGVAI